MMFEWCISIIHHLSKLYPLRVQFKLTTSPYIAFYPPDMKNYTMDRRKTQGGALTLKRTGVLIECVPAGYALPLSAVDLCLLMVMVSNFLIPTNEECTKLCRLIVTRTTPPQNWGRSLNPKLDSAAGGRIFRFFRS